MQLEDRRPFDYCRLNNIAVQVAVVRLSHQEEEGGESYHTGYHHPRQLDEQLLCFFNHLDY